MKTMSKIVKHVKCRGDFYPHTKIKRLEVPDKLIDWSVEWRDYNPPEYNSPVLQGKPWADFPIGDPSFHPRWNELDSETNRVSYHGPYRILEGFPLNPCGRTGLRGRGVLGKWGPNHAADPLVTRWKRDEANDGSIVTRANKCVLQLCVIQRVDCGEWALPGGMVDPGEKISATLKREFMEEAMNSLENTKENNAIVESKLDRLFSRGFEIYKGYVDDPRNTDNAWIETAAVNYHDDSGKQQIDDGENESHDRLGLLRLEAGDDARRVKWVDVSRDLKLYASHSDMIRKVVDRLDCYW